MRIKKVEFSDRIIVGPIVFLKNAILVNDALLCHIGDVNEVCDGELSSTNGGLLLTVKFDSIGGSGEVQIGCYNCTDGAFARCITTNSEINMKEELANAIFQ